MHNTSAALSDISATPRQSSFSTEDLIACGEGELFGPNTPRMPIGAMRMVDRISWISGKGGAYDHGEVRAELDINPSLWFFACHFRGDPVMPGCLGLDAMWQLVGFFLGWLGGLGHGRALGVGEVKFSGMVLPEAKKISYHIDLKRVIMRKLVVGIADGIMKVDGKVAYEAKDLRVGLFSDAPKPALMAATA